MNRIEQALTQLFSKHRIVLWYDYKQELQAEFDAVFLPEVEKIRLSNNQFSIKHRILRQEPDQQFLLYRPGPPPEDLQNWLLDVQLAYGEFRADQISLWLSELDLGLEFTDVVAPHANFFQTKQRRQALKELLQADDTPGLIRMKMLAVCAGADARLDDILEHLLADLAEEHDDKMHLIRRSALDDFLWERLERTYGYDSDSPGIRDFSIDLFKSCYAAGLDQASGLTNDALVFLKRWKDSVRHQPAFETFSEQCAGILSIEQDLHQRDYLQLVELDLFELIDRKILSDLVQHVAGRTISAGDCVQLIRQRRLGHWYKQYHHPYEAIEKAALFIQELEKVDLTMSSLAQGVVRYSQGWYQLDQLYRQFIFHLRQSGQMTLLAPLQDQVENLYSNNFLLTLNDNWQQVVDECETWNASPTVAQEDFYERLVAPFPRHNKKIYVIISDALRYEAGDELLRRIRQEDRYEASLEAALTMLPSFTQLGMAALLPHTSLSVNKNGTVLADGASTAGTENRKKILQRALPNRATAIKAEDLLTMTIDESRDLSRNHEVVYVYHNRIDATGDKRESEGRVFDAVEETFDELIRIIKKLANANANNMIITADHGFIYQNRELDESDFAGLKPSGAKIFAKNRRFVLGQGLGESSSFKRFTAADVGLEGEMEILIPKSINRLRVQGAGSRYIHGGAALQEVIIPILKINKKRQSDISRVNVDILRGSTSVITTGQLSVALYQTDAVTAKVQPRILRAGIYTESGMLISDQHELAFDFRADDPRQRELPVRFVLTREADVANDQEVILRLEERVAGTSHYQEYKAARYRLRRSFSSDFDL